MSDQDSDRPQSKPPRPSRSSGPRRPMSALALTGWFIIGASFAIGIVLLVSVFVLNRVSPYVSLVTYSLTPAGIGIGVGLLLLSLLLRWRRRRKGLPDRPWPVVDLNSHKVHVGILVSLIGLVTFVSVSGVATYQAYQFTESTQFCGTVCHQVMQPEYEAHFLSPHARVDCVACHIGPGADWYVRSKFSGLRQVYGVLTGDYHLPISVPIANLRPARETCEECHWPAKFEGSVEHVLWRYWYDRNNTPSRIHMLLKVGGVRPESGEPEGIHWHSSSKSVVRYWARDKHRQNIPWVEVMHPDGTRSVYTDGTMHGEPPRSEIRTMDCIDCHNRPAHIYKSPNTLVDGALADGRIDRSIPYAKRNAVQLLSLRYRSQAQAAQRIRSGIEQRYATVTQVSEQQRKQLSATLIDLYSRHNYPAQGVSFRTYANNIGHKTSAGCFRCHEGKHKTPKGEAISHKCDLCHEFTYQANGEAAYAKVAYKSRPFEHPGRVIEDYKSRLCSDCHNERVGWYPGNPADSILAAPHDTTAQATDTRAPDPSPQATPQLGAP